ncbi:hypothetical protein [Myroides sp. LJL119]
MKLSWIIFTLLIGISVMGQTRYSIQGKIVSRIKDLQGVYIANISAGSSTMSQRGGYFTISARKGDTLMFSGASFVGYQHALSSEDLNRDIILIPLERNEFYTELDEIVITKITSESLGLVPKGTKRLSNAEKRLYTATKGGGIISVDAIVNMISGRTKLLKQALAYEKQEMKKEKILNFFDAEYLYNEFSIPVDYAQGFGYYASGDAQMSVLLSGETFEKDKVKSRLGELALDFIELIDLKSESEQHIPKVE